jgi:hypothetical protein
MASKKLKRAAKVAAGISAAYLASQALKKPKAKPFSVVRRKGDTFGADTAQAYEASKPKDTFASDTPTGYQFGVTDAPIDGSEYMMDSNQGFGPMAKDGKFIKKKMLGGGSVVARGNKLARSKPTKLF